MTVEIDELVLHGFEPRDRWTIADAVRDELARLLAERGITAPPESLDIPGLDAGTITIGQPRHAGAPLAEALHATLTGANATKS